MDVDVFVMETGDFLMIVIVSVESGELCKGDTGDVPLNAFIGGDHLTS